MNNITEVKTHSRYSSIAILLHWVTALMIIGLIVVGKYMSDLPQDQLALKFSLYQWHKSFGITVFILTIIRIFWRLGHKPPPLPENMKTWEVAAAKITHVGFYALLLLLPLSGWLMVSASPFNIPTFYFNWLHIPHLPFTDDSKVIWEARFKSMHFYLATLTIATFLLHVGGALKHHFVLKDDVLTRMLPFKR